jgi:multidrug resistance protein, MATE family
MLAPPSVRSSGRAALRPYAVEMGALARIALPLVLAMIGQMAIMTTDMLMLGWLGPEALAATALALSAFHPVMLFGIGIGTAVTPLAAAALARRDVREMRRAVRQGLWAALPFTLLAVPALWWISGLFAAIGQDPGLSRNAELYMRGVLPGLFFMLVFNVLRSYATALQRTRPVLIVTLVAIPFNALVNYGLIFGAFGLPRLEILGAGIGSSITHFLMAMALLWIASRHLPFRRHHILGRFWRPDWPIFRAIHRIGIPIGLFILLEVGIFAGSAQILGFIGVYELAAHQIVLQLASITFMVPLGIGQAVTARVALARGRADPAGARIAGQASMLLATAFMSCTALVFWFLPAPLIRPFLDGSPESLRVLGFATGYLAIAAVFQIVDGLQVTAAHALRGLQDTRVPLLIAVFGFWILAFPTAVVLGLYTPLAGSGVWLGFALGLATAALLLIRRFLRLTRRPSPGSP